jgi:hypothetical protein
MSCDDTRRRLTAYLDGDLDADGGTLVRVHLRGCAACRQVASDEAALRDGLRALPALDPPPSLWAGVQARLAQAEEADAGRPRWRRVLARWAPAVPRLGAGGLVAAAAVTAVWWKTRRVEELPAGRPAPEVAVHPSPELRSGAAPAPAPPPPPPATSCRVPEAADVTADLALDAARRSGCYAAAAEELLAELGEVRAGWSADRRAAFDAQIASLRRAIADAEEGRPRHRAWRAMIRQLQHALVRDEVIALASGGRP